MSNEGVKTGLFGKIGSGATRRDEYTTAQRMGAWTAFKSMWSGHFTKALIVGFFTMIMCAPAVAWVIVSGSLSGAAGTIAPYNIFDGTGYPSPWFVGGEYGMQAAVGIGNLLYYDAALFRYSILIPCIAVAGVGLGAMTYIARLHMYGEQVKVLRAYFRGIAATWAQGLTGGALCGAGVFLVMLTYYSFDLHGYHVVGKVFALIGAILPLVFLGIFSFYLVTLASTYKTSYPRTLRDALLLTFAYFPKNMLAALISGALIGLMFLLQLLFGSSQLGMLPWLIMFFLGFYAIVSVFVAVSQGAFAKYITEGLIERETKLKNEQFYAAKRERKLQMKKAAEESGAAVKETKKQPARYVNPKKKKGGKPHKEEAEQTPAPEPVGGYTAKELAKMEEDRRKVAELSSGGGKEASGLEDLSVYTDDGD